MTIVSTQDIPPSSISINKKNHHHSNIVTKNGEKVKVNSSNNDFKLARNDIVMHKNPFLTLYYFFREIPFVLFSILNKVILHRKIFAIAIMIFGFIVCGEYVDGLHKEYFNFVKHKFFNYSGWIGLGFLSSCGFGTGLHTFVLYLGPFIAKVTLAAYECKSTAFLEPPFPDDIICSNTSFSRDITIFDVIKKVQFEAVFWGIGTAIGELPPYFLARAASLSGKTGDDEELEELEELLTVEEKYVQSLSFMKRCEKFLTYLVMKMGFLGIVACASIPNPFFDLAGMTCGHFLVPFWTFFGATVIGKAIIKMQIQQLFVIMIFSDHHLKTILSYILFLPWYGSQLASIFEDYLKQQKIKLHSGVVANTGKVSVIQLLTGAITWFLISYFIVSLVNTLAQRYYKRLCTYRTYAESVNKKDF